MDLSDNVKSFVSDSIIYTLFNLLNKVIPFILLPIIIRMVSPEDYGKYAIFLTVEALLIPIVSLNLPAALSSHYYIENINLKIYISTLVLSMIILTILFSIALYGIPVDILAKTGIDKKFLNLAILTGSSMGLVNMLSNLFRLQRKPWLYGIYSIGQSVLLLTFIILFCWINPNFLMLTLGRTSYALLFVLISFYILYYLRILAFSFSRKWFVRILKFSLPTVFYSISAFVFLSSDRFLIKYFLGIEKVGYYSAISQLASIISILGVSINAAWMPWLFENLKKNDDKINIFIVKISYSLIAAMLLIGAVFCFLYPFIAHFVLPINYQSSINIAYPIIMGFVFEGIYLIVSPYTFYAEKTKYNGFIGIIVAILNIALNTYLIPRLGIAGAAYSTFLTWFFLALLFFLFSYRVYPMPWFSFFRLKPYR